MLEEAEDLRTEGAELHGLLETLEEGDWSLPTPFKNWTTLDVVTHLHFADRLATESLKGPERFHEELLPVIEAVQSGRDILACTYERLGSPGPTALLTLWYDRFREMCDLLGTADPALRLKWLGPEMSVRTFAAARQMETWAHGQDVYDLLGVARKDTDRIKNIATLGVKTFQWTFANRGLEVPKDAPYVRLTAPSGVTWEWNEPKERDRVEGAAVDFCQVVTQTRNVADTSLHIVGETARRWMEIAQCFAGPPEDPPKPGTRLVRRDKRRV